MSMQLLFSLSPVPALPLAGLAHGSLLFLWGVVLAWLGLAVVVRILPQLVWRVRVVVACAIFTYCVLPVFANMPTLSPAYWLGLAFQSPSLALAAVALLGLWAHASAGARGIVVSRKERSSALNVLCMLGVALGWVLLLDTLAFWPRSAYALGFGAGALWCVALGLLVFAWLWNGVAMWALCAVLLVFAVSRLPSGNLWDALLDPLLWFGLHLKLLREVWAAYKAKKSHDATANTDPAQ